MKEVIARTQKDAKPIAAWLIKGNPQKYDCREDLKSGVITGWTVHPSYRIGLMRPGHPAYFFITGRERDLPPGLYGVGTVLRRPFPNIYEREEGAEPAEYLRPGEVFGYVDLNVRVLSSSVPREVIADDPVLARSELIKSPAMSNPVILTPDQVRALSELAADPAPVDEPSPEYNEEASYLTAEVDGVILALERLGLMWMVTKWESNGFTELGRFFNFTPAATLWRIEAERIGASEVELWTGEEWDLASSPAQGVQSLTSTDLPPDQEIRDRQAAALWL